MSSAVSVIGSQGWVERLQSAVVAQGKNRAIRLRVELESGIARAQAHEHVSTDISIILRPTVDLLAQKPAR